MMNLSSDSQCGSGCDSGWTLYLDQSSFSKTQWQSFSGILDENHGDKAARLEDDEGKEQEEEEDLSMVSDASSGRRHYYEEDEDCLDENGCFCSAPSAKKSTREKKIKQAGRSNQQHSYLDDTASSPVVSFSKNDFKKEASTHVLDFSQGCSATHYKGKSKLQKSFNFLQSSFAGKPGSKEAGDFHGRKWE